MTSDRQEFQNVITEWEAANQEYHDYVEQFFTHTFNGEVTKVASKALSPQDLEKIKSLRDRSEQLEGKLRKILES